MSQDRLTYTAITKHPRLWAAFNTKDDFFQPRVDCKTVPGAWFVGLRLVMQREKRKNPSLSLQTSAQIWHWSDGQAVCQCDRKGPSSLRGSMHAWVSHTVYCRHCQASQSVSQRPRTLATNSLNWLWPSLLFPECSRNVKVSVTSRSHSVTTVSTTSLSCLNLY